VHIDNGELVDLADAFTLPPESTSDTSTRSAR
jgi:hypothetical protein